jgi:hypothetical protein
MKVTHPSVKRTGLPRAAKIGVLKRNAATAAFTLGENIIA